MNNNSELFRKKTHCIFASSAKFWDNSYEWDSEKTIEENVECIKPDLDKYVNHLKNAQNNSSEPFDSFIIEAPANIYSQTMEDVAEWLYRILYNISSESIEKLIDLSPSEDGSYMDNGWEFRYKDTRFFVLTTTPLYEEWHSRYCGGTEQNSVIIHLQPMFSFDYHFNNSPIGCPSKIVTKIRKTFARFGRNYESDFPHTVARGSTNRLHEAPKYLKPRKKCDDIIKWWVPRPFRLR
ncbi:hypothetical protein BS333_04425 [Vibrio azureus]|uniref:YqcI/YcgG family protein n=1 Tax=Vibrio azureus NBRC 104587 TaxID=1219077 RepID=U3C9A5_9VIBR|nr:YqcI/YcgG family protein [Vibrio azureus]AUI85680.1 hypothetical protein BS333_04425 [Vibrio azureus]GAD77944.1 hypothetical protein VAZ01S_101_00100 [Vibrio azureus NBRC 104587]